MKIRRLATIASVVALLATGSVAASPSHARNCSMMETVALKTFYVTVKAKEKVYKVGETAQVVVTVTRPAHEDPAGLGVYQEPPHSEPAENVNAGIGLRVGDVFLFGHGMTNPDGKAIVDVKLEPWTPSGTAIADAFVWNVVVDTPCLRIEENGYTQKPNIFEVIKTR